jgi:DNA-binding winged helix-turn-helix (wHTH) protein
VSGTGRENPRLRSFGEFELDEVAHELRHSGRPLDVQRRVYDLLAHLVRNEGRAVSRHELLDVVWRDVVVEDGSLSRAIRLARRLLALDPATADALETIRGHGYRIRLPEWPAVETNAQTRTPFAPTPAFYGRRQELAALERLLGTALHGPPQLALVTGEPGIGKTALVDRALATCPVPFRIGRGVCLETYGAGEPFLPLLQALDEILGRGRGAPDTDFSIRRVADQVVRAAEDGPIALVIEDLHWSDASTLDALAHLLLHFRSPGLALVATQRSSDPGNRERLEALRSDLAARGLVRRIALARLEEADLREWLAARTAGTVPDRLVERLATASGGNPLLVRALLDASADGPDDSGRVTVESLLARLEALPRELELLVARQIERLDEGDRLLLQCAAVAGTTPTVVRVAAAAGRPEAEVEERLEVLATPGGWLTPVSLERWPDGSLDTRLEFGHGLHVQALCAGVPLAKRARMHAAIAQRLIEGYRNETGRVAVELVHHLERSEQHAQALRYRVEAAQHAVRRNAGPEALAHAEAGLRQLDRSHGAERARLACDLQLVLALAVGAIRGHADPQVAAAYERARELADGLGDEARLLSALWGLSSCRLMKGEIEAAAAAAESLLERGRQTDDRAQMLVAHDLLSEARYFGGSFARCAEHADEMMRLYRPDLDDGLELRVAQGFRITSRSYGALAKWHLGQTSAAIRASQLATAAADETGHPFSRAVAHCFAAILAHLLEEEADFHRHVDALARVAEEADLPLWRGTARVLAAWTRPAAEAIAEMEVGLAEMARTGRLGGTYFLGLLAEKRRELGDREGARGLIDTALSIVEAIGERHDEANLHLRRARLADDPDAALASFRRAREIAEARGSRAIALRAACDEAELLDTIGVACGPVATRIRVLCEEMDPEVETPELRRASVILDAPPRAPVISLEQRRPRS